MSADTTPSEFARRFTLLQAAIEFNGIRSRNTRYPHWLCDEFPKHPYRYWLQELLDMPAKKSGKKGKFQSDMTFINYKFTAETKADFQAQYEDKKQPLIAALEETIKAQNKLSVSWDDDRECFTAAMTGKEESLNPGKCLTIKSDNWAKALFACAYVHTIVFDGEIWDVDDSTDMV